MNRRPDQGERRATATAGTLGPGALLELHAEHEQHAGDRRRPKQLHGTETAFGNSAPVQMTRAAATSPQTAGTRTSPRQRRPSAMVPLEARNVPTVYISSALVTK